MNKTSKYQSIISFSEIASKLISSDTKKLFLTGFLLCLFAGLCIIYIISPLTGVSKSFGGTGHDGYLQIASNLIRGNGFVFEAGGSPPLHRAPLFPCLIAPLTLLPEVLQRVGLIMLHSAIVGGIAVLIFLIAESFFNVMTARLAVIIFLLNPWIYWNAKNPMTPITQGFLYILFVFLISRIFLADQKNSKLQNQKKWWFQALCIGFTGGALILSHGGMLASGAMLLFVLFVFGIFRKNLKYIKIAILSGVIALLLVSPWTYRNWMMFKRFIPVTSQYGFAYFNGLVHWNISGEHARRDHENHKVASLRYIGLAEDESQYLNFYGVKDPNIDAEFNNRMREHIQAQPVMFIKKVLLHSVDFYFPTLVYPFLAVKVFSIEELLITVFNLFLWGLAFTGIWLRRDEKQMLIYSGLILFVIALYAVLYLPIVTHIGHHLYTFGTISFLSILAGRAFVPED